QPRRCRRRAVIVIDLDAPVQRQLVLDPQFDVDCAGRLAGDERRRDLPVWEFVGRGQLRLQGLEVERLAALDRVHLPTDESCAVKFGTGYGDGPNRDFDDLQLDDAL